MTDRLIRVGLLFEGTLDEKPFKILIKRIRPNLKIDFILYKADGGTENKLKPASTYFFENEQVDFAVFHSDLDGVRGRRRKINTWIKRYIDSERPEAVIVPAFIDPCFESWIICEECALKKIYSISGSSQLPHSTLHPKKQLSQIDAELNTDITRRREDAYLEAVKILDIELLSKRDKDFKKFKDALENLSL